MDKGKVDQLISIITKAKVQALKHKLFLDDCFGNPRYDLHNEITGDSTNSVRFWAVPNNIDAEALSLVTNEFKGDWKFHNFYKLFSDEDIEAGFNRAIEKLTMELKSDNHRSHLMTCNVSPTKKCNAYTTYVHYNDGHRRMYILCEYCQANWHKEVMDQLHKDLGDDIIMG